MTRTRRAAIRFAAALAVAGVALGGARELLRYQAALARRRIGKALGETALDADRVWKKGYGGEPLELLVLGDSIAAGLGAERPKDTLGARVARGVAKALHRPVRLRCAAVVVGTCPDLGALRPVPQPLRALGSRLSRQLAAAQEAVARRHGARAVSLARTVGPFFVTNPER